MQRALPACGTRPTTAAQPEMLALLCAIVLAATRKRQQTTQALRKRQARTQTNGYNKAAKLRNRELRKFDKDLFPVCPKCGK